MGIEQFHKLGKVGQGPGQPIHLVDHHDLDPAQFQIRQQALQAGSLGVAPREAAVLIGRPHRFPALGLFAEEMGGVNFWRTVEKSRLCS